MYTASRRSEKELGAVTNPGPESVMGRVYGTAETQGREVGAREWRAGDWTWRHSTNQSVSLVYCRRVRR